MQLKGIKFAGNGSGQGSWLAFTGEGLTQAFSVAKYGEREAYIMALEARLEYLDGREKFKLDFTAFDLLVKIKSLFEAVKEHGVEYMHGDKYMLHLIEDVLERVKK